MPWIDYFLRLKALVFHRRAERELAEELRSHLEMEAAYGMRRGLTREEAERAARAAFGGEDRTAEECRDVRGLRWLEDFVQDLRYAVRQLRKQRAFFAVAAGTLTLGIGATTAMFSVVNGVLLRPLPYPEPDRLASLWCVVPARGLMWMGFAWPDLVALAERNHSFETVAGFYGSDYNLTGDVAEQIQGAHASVSLFPMLGANAALGRTFLPEEANFGKHHVVLLSDGLWRRRFGARQEILGQTVRISGELYRVIGVMPPEFRFPNESTQLWMPISFGPKDDMGTRGNHYISAIARLRPGVTVAAARTDVGRIAHGLEREFNEDNAGIGMAASDYLRSMVGDIRPALFILFAAVGVVLLIACVNVANLLLARASARQRELSVRTALGAGRGRLVRQLLAESMLLGGAGGVLGLALSFGLVRLIRIFGPAGIPRIRSVEMDLPVLLFTVAAVLVSAFLFGVAPAIRAARVDVSDALKQGGRSLTGGRGAGRARDALVVAEITLSLTLVIGAGLLLRTLQSLEHQDPGFRPDHVLSMSVTLPEASYPESEPSKRIRFCDEVLRRVEAIPGVKAAGANTAMPITGWGGWGKSFTVDEHPAARLTDVPMVRYCQVTPGYFRALEIPLRQGRFFDASDVAGRPLVAIINESARRQFFPHEDPVGKRVFPGPPELTVAAQLPKPNFQFPRYTIVGVVAGVRQFGLREAPLPELYTPYLQAMGSENEPAAAKLFLMVRTGSDPLRFADAVLGAVRSIDADQPVAAIDTMERRVGAALESERFQLFLFGSFAVIALVLAAVGVYGVMSYAVRQRMHEIGIRMALGAGSGDVLRMVAAHGLRLGAAGIVAGLGLAYGTAQLISSLLFGVPPHDWITLASAAVVLLAVIAVASFVPSLRAARTDALSVLRAE